MEKGIFIVTTVVYDHSDSNLWSNAKAFADEETAKEYFKREGAECYADAQGQDQSDDPDEFYSVDAVCETECEMEYVRETDGPVHYKVEITKQEIEL